MLTDYHYSPHRSTMSILIRTLNQHWPIVHITSVFHTFQPCMINARVTQVRNFTALKDKVKSTVIIKWGRYWSDLIKDYTDVFKETADNAKKNPKRAMALCSLIGFAAVCLKTNPDYIHFRDNVIQCSNELLLVPKSIRNPKVEQFLTSLESCFNLGVVRRLSFGIISIIWIDNYDSYLGIYKANCSFLKPQYVTFTDRVVDIGFVGHWWKLKSMMKDCDVNIDEWNS